MLSLDHISIQFSGRYLFDDVSLMIGPHDRIGLVGLNGTGKTTLLKIIAGMQQPEEGTISKARYVTVGYLPQDGITSKGRTLYGEAETAFEDVLTVREELEEVHLRMSQQDTQSEEYMESIEIFGELQHKLEDLDAFRMKSKIEQVLVGLGFSERDFNRQTEEFSGGWQMRIELVKLLLREPSILLLDEPTNHLDLDSLRWLEEYLRQYHGAVILVSHDRAFLDALCTITLALEQANIEEYAGNYSFYEQERKIRRELLFNAMRNQQQMIKQTEAFIERFRYKATKARQVQSRIKQLDKIDRIELDGEEEEIHFRFPPPPSAGKIVCSLSKLSKRYGSVNVFRDLDYVIERGDRIAVVGVNGAGKSTLVRMIAGIEPLTSGDRTLGYNVILSYFGQHQAEELDLRKDALSVVDEVATGEIRTKLRTILGSFLFHGDDVFKKVAVLSGGEKSRLALAKMLLQPSNFLIMDEPTNHLDMRSKKVLQGALANFDGTYLIVSHDRSFLDPIVTKVLEIGRGEIKIFLGNVSDYLAKKQSESGQKKAAVVPVVQEKTYKNEKERKRLEAEWRQQIYREILPLRTKFTQAEKKIENRERRKAEIEQLMANADFYKNGDTAKNITAEYKFLQKELEDLMKEWTDLSDEIARRSALPENFI